MNFYQTQNKKTKRAHTLRCYKRQNWFVAHDRAEKLFNTLIKEEGNERFFTTFFNDNKDSRRIQLSTGQHPTGTMHKTTNKMGGITSSLDYEKGAALVISQHELGSVFIGLYPYESPTFKVKNSPLTWGVFDDPTKVTDAILNRVLIDFFRYIRVSSVLLSESWYDRTRIRYLELRSNKYKLNNIEENKSIMALVCFYFKEIAAVIASIIAIIGFIK